MEDSGARPGRITPQDATMYWLSRRTRNDLFLLFGFADRGVPTAELRARVIARSARVPELRVRLRPVPRDLDYPSWVRCGFRDDQFVEHRLPRPEWDCLLDAVGELLGTGVDATERPWRLHVFRGVVGAPRRADDEELATVAVLQISHALADGERASAIARVLFGDDGISTTRKEFARPEPEPEPEFGSAFRVGAEAVFGLVRLPVQVGQTVVRGVAAYRAARALAAATAAGEVPAPGPAFTPTVLNRGGATAPDRGDAAVADGTTATVLNRGDAAEVSGHRVRMLVVDAADLRATGRTITVVVLTAVSVALAEYLAGRGETVTRLGAQVPIAVPSAHARNNYRSAGVDLHVDEPALALRADRIAADLADRRARVRHPLLGAQDRVIEVTPAPVLRRDIVHYPLGTPATVAGHTVVSSVRRGPADLDFGGPVRCTGGFPAVGSVMRLTHGVHGLGDTVAISVHVDPAVVPDPDVYTELLRAALVRVSRIAPPQR